MKICPITYEDCGPERYSLRGLRKINPRLKSLNDFPYNAAEQRKESLLRVGKMSIQGMQPKLSARLDLKNSGFIIVDAGGRFIIKPQHADYLNLPENEDVTMRLAAIAGVKTPLHGLLHCIDGTYSYFVKRFDRVGRAGRIPLEDFAQLAGLDRETKYDYSMEKLVALLNYCTFPAVERSKLFARALFNFLVGNEDMHLKNFSLITIDGKVELAPAYDFLNSTLAYQELGKRIEEIEEVALPLRGKKKRLTRDDWVKYYGTERLGLPGTAIEMVLSALQKAIPQWKALIDMSFLSARQKELYLELIDQRGGVLSLI